MAKLRKDLYPKCLLSSSVEGERPLTALVFDPSPLGTSITMGEGRRMRGELVMLGLSLWVFNRRNGFRDIPRLFSTMACDSSPCMHVLSWTSDFLGNVCLVLVTTQLTPVQIQVCRLGCIVIYFPAKCQIICARQSRLGLFLSVEIVTSR